MRVAIYARYSSDLQDKRSIADQIALSVDRAVKEGWTVVSNYTDAAISGGSMVNRTGLQALLTAASTKAFEIILTESLDRLSRDLEDMAAIYKRLTYFGVKIVTLADGEVGQLHVGLKGLIANLFLEDLAQKTRRGQRGRAVAGRIPGGRCYGYDVVSSTTDRGQRSINEDEAVIVRRIFDAYVNGESPRAIAACLNAEGVPGPRGGLWNASAISGSQKRQNGVLNNTLYSGELTYNRQRFIKDPQSGRRQARGNDPGQWLRTAIPELRLVDPEVWRKAQARRASGNGAHFSHQRRPKRLLSGLLRCACCGGSYIVCTRNYVGCSRRINSGACTNKRMVATSEIEKRVVAALEKYLLSPEAVEVAVEAYRTERVRLSQEAARMQSHNEKARDDVKRRTANILAAIESGAETKPLVARLRELEAQQDALEEELRAAAPQSIVSLHPQAAARYRQKVAEIHQALAGGHQGNTEAVALMRELIAEIRIIPRGADQPVSLEIVGDLAVLMASDQVAPSGTVLMVAGAGFEPTTFRL